MSLAKFNKSFIGLADFYGKTYASLGTARPFGSIDKCDLAFEVEMQKERNYGRDGGMLKTNERVTSIVATLSFQSLSLPNLAIGMRGSLRSENTGTVTDEEHTVTVGGFIRLKGISQTNVVLKNNAGDVTYVDGVHYRRGGSGIQILDGATETIPAIADAAVVKVSYTHAGIDVVEALTAAQPEMTVHFDGLNEAEGGENVAVDFWRWKPSVLKSLSLIGNNFARAEISGDLLLDPTQNLPGRSKFFRWVSQQAA